jgi:hypothetical protein
VEHPPACPRASTRHRRSPTRMCWPDSTDNARPVGPARSPGLPGAHLVVVHHEPRKQRDPTDRSRRSGVCRGGAMPGHPPGTRTPARRRGEGVGCTGARAGEPLGSRSRTGCPRGWLSRSAALHLGRVGRAIVRRPRQPPSRCRSCWSLAGAGRVGPLDSQGVRLGSPGRSRVPRRTQAPCVPPTPSPLFHVEHRSLPLRSSGDGPTARIGRTAGPMSRWPGRPGPRKATRGRPACSQRTHSRGRARVEPIWRRAGA